jgi:glucose/mannose-6-phosphate isomerase
MTSERSGSLLDESAALGRRDPRGMIGLIGELPRQIRMGWQISRGLALADAHRSAKAVAVLGMGGSAAAGDIVRGVFSDRLSVPLVSVRDYELPAWVGRETLVVAVSHSGATEETISALTTALERRCPVAVITTGGPLGEVAARANLPRLVYANESEPRAALGYTLALLCGLLERAGLLALTEAEIEAAAVAVDGVVAADGPHAATDISTAKQLAWSLVGRLPVVEAAGFLAPVARRWRTQLNENAKSTALAEELPEATHNSVVGYEQPEILRDHAYYVFLASPLDHPRSARRQTVSAELLTTLSISHQVIPVAGEGRLAQACAAIALGDYVSAYLALLYGIDPTPVDAIGHIKRSLTDDVDADADAADDPEED